MALPVQEQLKYWGVAAAALIAALWLLGDVMLPFVLGGAIAYFLDPVADRFEAWGLPRVVGVAIIALIAVVILVPVSLYVLNLMVQETAALIASLPERGAALYASLVERFPALADSESTLRQQVEQTLSAIGGELEAAGGQIVSVLAGSVSGVFGIVALAVITPVVAFYLLLDWDRIIARIDDLLPRDHAPVIRHLAGEIDKTLSGFLRGQGTVCLILGIYYAVALVLVGLDFGLVVGAIAGLLTFIPYVGALVGGTLAIGLALFQFWGDWVWIALVAAIFFSGQFVEGNILTPKLVGSSVGLHPVWLLFALSAFGMLFGFVGMLVAVPVAAVIGVLARFFIGQYKTGRLYQGLDRPDPPGGG